MIRHLKSTSAILILFLVAQSGSGSSINTTERVTPALEALKSTLEEIELSGEWFVGHASDPNLYLAIHASDGAPTDTSTYLSVQRHPLREKGLRAIREQISQGQLKSGSQFGDWKVREIRSRLNEVCTEFELDSTKTKRTIFQSWCFGRDIAYAITESGSERLSPHDRDRIFLAVKWAVKLE